ncbi:MAG: gliding motility lipoprotein GldH [Bacteroidia bacterium]|nr:gliding motility lipoprotein GldH [Bacteroidia bacterium]
MKNILILILTLYLMSCHKNVVYSKYIKFENEEWKRSDTATFDFEISDTKPLYNLYLNIRHADGYPFSNLYMFVQTSYPDGTLKQDTLEIELADPKGRWHGSGLGDIFDLHAPLKQNFKFTQPGKYRIRFIQAMRTDPLPLLMEIGVELKLSK